MCGIAAFLGKDNAKNILIECLERMEYRGYDSCGVALVPRDSRHILCLKDKGRIKTLKSKLRKVNVESPCGIAHTRWATHGAPIKKNAHPHHDSHSNIFVVHNGIIENFEEIKEQLQKEGHVFHSDTDTEVIPHLIEKNYKGNLLQAVMKTVRVLKGSFAFCAISSKEPRKIVGVRFFSPLILGVAERGLFLTSDVPALLPYTKKVVYLQDREVAVLEKGYFKILDFEGKTRARRPVTVSVSLEQAEKNGFKHFMLKEIFEQPGVIKDLYGHYVKRGKVVFPEIKLSKQFIKGLKRVHVVACGTAFHAGLVGKYLFEKWAGLQCISEVSSEFRYKDVNIHNKEELFITITQSGETADTLASLSLANKMKMKTLGVCNVPGSSLTRETGSVIYTNAGPEIGVASTKAYTAQITVLLLLALYIAGIKGTLDKKTVRAHLEELEKVWVFQRRMLKSAQDIEVIAEKFCKFGNFLFLGRNINYPSAMEGALKLKEISYIPAEGYPAGEMKHGPIALIDEYRGVICINPQTELYEKMYSNMQEIKARKGKIIGILTENDSISSHLCDETIYMPALKEELTPLLVALPLQLFAYYVASGLGHDVDKPRNLAKSVTVE